tara:strand:+ start:2595 stop:2951 length:357 start_codon:yes stop_codon:yes gene_type:complete
MNDRWINAPVPQTMLNRSQNESQLAQLIRWWCWVREVPLSRCEKDLDVGKDTLQRGLQLGNSLPNLIHSLHVTFFEEFGIAVDTSELDTLTSLKDSAKNKKWRATATKLQGSWVEAKT